MMSKAVHLGVPWNSLKFRYILGLRRFKNLGDVEDLWGFDGIWALNIWEFDGK